METLTFYFPVVTRDGATLDMHWGTTVVPMRIMVDPSRPPDISTSERRDVRRAVSPNARQPARTACRRCTLDVTLDGGRLHARATPPLWGYDPAFDLVPFGHDGEFRSSFSRGGKLFGMEVDAQLAFTASRAAT